MANTMVFLDLGYSSCDYHALERSRASTLVFNELDSLSGCVIQPSVLLRFYWEYIFICAVRLSIREVPANTEHRGICLGNLIGRFPIGYYRDFPSVFS